MSDRLTEALAFIRSLGDEAASLHARLTDPRESSRIDGFRAEWARKVYDHNMGLTTPPVAEAISAAGLGYERGLRDGRLKVEASEWVRLNTFAVRRCDVVRVAIEPDPPRVVVIVGGDALAVTGMTFDEVLRAVSGLEVA